MGMVCCCRSLDISAAIGTASGVLLGQILRLGTLQKVRLDGRPWNHNGAWYIGEALRDNKSVPMAYFVTSSLCRSRTISRIHVQPSPFSFVSRTHSFSAAHLKVLDMKSTLFRRLTGKNRAVRLSQWLCMRTVVV